MRKDVDSLQAVEMLMALEEQLDGPLQRRVPALAPYLVSPFTAEWNDRGSLSEVWVVARHGVTVLFASFEATVYGVGVFNLGGEIHRAVGFADIETAAVRFLAAARKAA
jgi:hypothetical protein